jgi:hypothetical protein
MRSLICVLIGCALLFRPEVDTPGMKAKNHVSFHMDRVVGLALIVYGASRWTRLYGYCRKGGVR